MPSVRLVDEGGKAVVGVDQLRFLPEQFRCLPCQVMIVILIVAMIVMVVVMVGVLTVMIVMLVVEISKQLQCFPF